VPGDQVFHLNHDTFRSDPKDPIKGNAIIRFSKVTPALLFAWGNIISLPRHFSIPFEFGVVFHGAPDLTFDLSEGLRRPRRGCKSINNDPDARSDVEGQRVKIEGDLSVFSFTP
jgi:hypothetical protein